MISCILLAAGESKRFGSLKALAKINNQTLIERLISTLKKAKIDEIIVVLGAAADEIKKVLPTDVKICINENYAAGQTSSLKTGLKSISKDADCFLVQPVDMPAISTFTINHIIDKFKEEKPLIAIPTYQSRRGHPPIYDIKLKDEILSLNDADPLFLINRRFLKQEINVVVNDPAILSNINTPEDLKNIK